MKARDDTRPPVAFGHVFLNVTDVSTSADCLKLGMSCTETESTDFHDKFTITGPDGYLISAYSSHASEKPV